MLLGKTAEKKYLLVAGLSFLILASLTRYFLPRFASVPENIADGGLGLIYGLAIGLLLLSLRRGRRPDAQND